MKILLVEDDQTIAAGLEYSLQQEGYAVQVCFNYHSAEKIIQQDLEGISLCIFDLSLPDGSGYDLCKLVKSKRDIPVIFLTVIDDEVNVVMGLDMGADDYITKPFRIRELMARIKSVMRRYDQQRPRNHIVAMRDIKIDTLARTVYKQGKEISLTALEYRLLLTFANHYGQTLTRDQLLEHIWDVAGNFVNDNTLTVYIKRLREKLEDDPKNPQLIQTIRGVGYKVGD